MKIGIVGCGGIATGKHLPALAEIENIEIKAFCDLDVDLAFEVKDKYGSNESKVFTDYQEMLSETDLDIVYVLTPNDTHAKISIAAMEAGNHVMCEKPMAKTTAEA